MSRWIYDATGLEPGRTYRIDTASGSTSAATISRPGGGAVIAGAQLIARPDGSLPRFEAGSKPLYAKPLDWAGTAGTPVTVTSTWDGDASTSASSTVASGAPARAAVTGVLAKLARGGQGYSPVLQIIGDSTGTDTTEWFGVLVRKIAAAYPTHSLLWRAWNTTTQWYDPPTQLTTGTGNGGGQRGCTTASGMVKHAGSVQLPTSTSSQDLDLIAQVSPTAGWAPGGAAAKRTIVARWQAAGSRSWTFYLDEAGKLGFEWSADGTATVATVVSTAAVPFTGTSAGWVRVQFDADNGASGNTATFQTSTDGVTWTTLGTAVTTATAATVFAGTIVYTFGGRGSTGSDYLDGTTYWVEVYGVLSGTSRYSVVPPLGDAWDQVTTSASVSFVGAPVILAVVGSASGQNTTYFDETSRKLRMNAPHGQDVVFLSTGHNESHVGFVATVLAWVASVRTRQGANVPLVVVSQNPVYLGSLFSSVAQVSQRYKRSAELMTAVAASPTAGVYPLDVYPAFDLTLSALQGSIESDGTHPKQDDSSGTSGSELWGGYAARQLFGI